MHLLVLLMKCKNTQTLMEDIRLGSRDHSETLLARLVETEVETTGQDLPQTKRQCSIASAICVRLFR